MIMTKHSANICQETEKLGFVSHVQDWQQYQRQITVRDSEKLSLTTFEQNSVILILKEGVFERKRSREHSV